MRKLRNPEIVILFSVDNGLRARFCLDGVMSPVFGSPLEGQWVVDQHERENVVSPARAKGMKLAMAYFFNSSSRFMQEWWTKSLIIRSDGSLLCPPGEGGSGDLSPAPIIDDTIWNLNFSGVSPTVH